MKNLTDYINESVLSSTKSGKDDYIKRLIKSLLFSDKKIKTITLHLIMSGKNCH